MFPLLPYISITVILVRYLKLENYPCKDPIRKNTESVGFEGECKKGCLGGIFFLCELEPYTKCHSSRTSPLVITVCDPEDEELRTRLIYYYVTAN